MPYLLQIVQNPNHVIMLHEFVGAMRAVYMDKADQIERRPATHAWTTGVWGELSVRRDMLVIDSRSTGTFAS